MENNITCTSEGAISHYVLYYQQLSITRYQVSFHANNLFELLPIVSTAFKTHFDAVGKDSDSKDLTKALGSYLLKLTISANIVAPMARQCFHANSSRLLELCCCSPSLKSNKNHSVSTVVNLKDKLFMASRFDQSLFLS